METQTKIDKMADIMEKMCDQMKVMYDNNNSQMILALETVREAGIAMKECHSMVMQLTDVCHKLTNEYTKHFDNIAKTRDALSEQNAMLIKVIMSISHGEKTQINMR